MSHDDTSAMHWRETTALIAGCCLLGFGLSVLTIVFVGML